MTVATFSQPDSTAQPPTAWGAGIDGDFSVHHRLAGPFAPHAQSTPDMTVRLDAGAIPQWLAKPLEVAAQSTATITAPVSNSRKDIVYVDALTGAVGVATGTPGASPSDPDIPAGKVAVARVTLSSATTAISNSLIDDLRTPQFLGMGTASGLNFDTDATLAADSDSKLASQKATKAYVDTAVASAATAADITALRQGQAELYLLTAINSAMSAGTFPNGGFDAFNTDTIGANSTNQTYDGTNKLYGNPGSASTSGTYGAANSNNRNWGGGWSSNTYSAMRFQAGSSGTVTSVAGDIDTVTTGCNVVAYLYTDNAGAIGSLLATSGTLSVSTGATTYTFTFSAPPTVVSGTNYFVVFKDVSGTGIVSWKTCADQGGQVLSGSYSAIAGMPFDGSHNPPSTEDWRFKANITLAPPNMTLVSNALTTPASVTTAMAQVLYKAVDAATLNTDVTLEVSANGGTNWTSATLSDTGATVNGFKVLWSSASGLTAGTSVKYRLKTFNNKQQQIKGVTLMAK